MAKKREKRNPDGYTVLGRAEEGFRMFAADYEGYICNVWSGSHRDDDDGVSFARHMDDAYHDAEKFEHGYQKSGSTIEIWIEDGEVRAR